MTITDNNKSRQSRVNDKEISVNIAVI